MSQFFSPHRANGRGSKPSVHEFHCPQGPAVCDQAVTIKDRIAPQCPRHCLQMIPLDVWQARWGADL